MKIADSSKDIVALRQHLKDIVEGPAFKGSHRSAQFLIYVVEQSIAGRFESLKERLIGVELFGRDASYDTGVDAIVRVTASDVRRRLLRHYTENGSASTIRINLPSGSYIPEITPERPGGDQASATSEAPQQPELQTNPTGNQADSPEVSDTKAVVADHGSVSPATISRSQGLDTRHWILIGCVIVAVGFAALGFSWKKARDKAALPPTIFPWTVLFSPTKPTHLITSDPNMIVIQKITGSQISVSDYANRQYIPASNHLTPEQLRYCHLILWGDNSAAAVDPPITARIAALAEAYSGTIAVQPARGIQLADLKTNDNFIFLGSPRSNPWSALFERALDFRFVYDEARKLEIIQNVHPRRGEQAEYVPTALGWATGQSYAIIGFVQNLEQKGQILLLAGLSGEGTEAAGRFVTDPARLSEALRACGVQPSGPLKHFEILLRLSTMAGSPTAEDIVACHAGN